MKLLKQQKMNTRKPCKNNYKPQNNFGGCFFYINLAQYKKFGQVVAKIKRV